MSKGKLKANIQWLSDPKIAVTVAVVMYQLVLLAEKGLKRLWG